jgi:16S rRNA (uracil1498-N3)-methyltransferase
MDLMKKHTTDAHEFSLYWPEGAGIFPSLSINTLFRIDNDALYHRIVRVLRLSPGAIFILFDCTIHMRVQIVAVRGKRSVELKLLSKNENVTLLPTITFFLPLLKRDALEQAIYSMAELGATDIRLMSTQKVQRTWGGDRERDRLHTIMIAAAEQSKQYRMPTLHEPKAFAECVQQMEDSARCFFFDPMGKDLLPSITSLQDEQPKCIQLMVGPEGDLTMQEKEQLKERGVQFLCLTSTVLRAQQAVAVALGIFRSLL